MLVSPTPPSLADDTAGSPASKLTAMVAIRPLHERASPSTDMLCDLFGLSRAEAEVALSRKLINAEVRISQIALGVI